MDQVDRCWRYGPAPSPLEPQAVHIWRASLQAPDSAVDGYESILSADERERAHRFVFARDSRRFTIGRGVLRHLLARYTDQDPEQLKFNYGPQGKPELVQDPANTPLYFNLSHSADLALCAIAREREVGVDVEYVRSNLELDGIAEISFSPTELATLRALPPGLQRQAFFNCWTRKEAFVKARGEGLSLPLQQFDVSLTPGQPAALRRTQWAPDEAPTWFLQALHPAEGYAAALAIRGQGWKLRTYEWSHSSWWDPLESTCRHASLSIL